MYLVLPSGETSLIKKGFINIVLLILSIIPLRLIDFIGFIVGSLASIIPNRHLYTTKVNLEIVFPNKNKEELKKLTRKSLINSATTLLESGFVWKRLNNDNYQKYIKAEGFESIKKELSKGKGLIIFTPHMANIETLIFYLGLKTNCMIPFTKVKHKELNEIVLSARAKMGSKMREANLSGVKSMLVHLDSGGVVAVASDQVPKNGKGGETASFFGHQAKTISLVGRLYSKRDVSIFSMVSLRKVNSKIRFHLRFSEELNDFSKDPLKGTSTMNRELEKCIMLSPEQYAWEYKRFKKSSKENLYK
ncbi:MAG: hypothetical protein CMB53_00815 [Euryarchaeota archaeon]|nr:hypothetical protein [Euryarchaeota archaeon]